MAFEEASDVHLRSSAALSPAEKLEENSKLCARVAMLLGKALPPGARAALFRRPENFGLIGYLSAEERRELGLETLPTLTWEEWEAWRDEQEATRAREQELLKSLKQRTSASPGEVRDPRSEE